METKKRTIRVTQSVVAPLLHWYAQNKRILPWREDPTPYHVWISEIMLQQTRVEAVKSYYQRFLQQLPTVTALANAPQELLLKLWEGLGYYNRVRNLQIAAQQIVSDFDGEFPSDIENIRKLKGIGPYTSAAIASICFGQTTPAVDGNVLRVVSRLCAFDAPIDQEETKRAVYAALEAVMPKSATADFTQAWMELGATVCLPNGTPLCEQCPLQGQCLAMQSHTQMDYPCKTPKKSRKVQEMTVYILQCGDRFAIRKRPAKGLLAGLWEFPYTESRVDIPMALQQAAAFGVQPIDIQKSSEKKHIFTHIEWKMQGIYLQCAAMPKDFVWASREELEQIYALPTAFRQFTEE